MSAHAEMNGGRPDAAAPAPRTMGPTQPAAAARANRSIDLDLVACDTCRRSFVTLDGPGMLAAIKGPCPDCGGRFELESLP